MKRHIYFVPLELLPSRYTVEMRTWVCDALNRLSAHVDWSMVVPAHEAQQSIAHGQFLDSANSNAYKAQQLQVICQMFAAGTVNPGSVFLFGDFWFPGVEMVRMLADLHGVQVTLVGWDYAGMADPHDYYAKTLGAWAGTYERLLVTQVFDVLAVGSRAHKQQIEEFVGHPLPHVQPYGLAWDSSHIAPARERVKRVVFPHRFAAEKQPTLFIAAADALHTRYPEWTFEICTNRDQAPDLSTSCVRYVVHATKQDYFDYISASAIVVSCALQETFGYAIQEAIAGGCCVLAPRRASYPEMLCNDDRFLYATDADFVGALEVAMQNPVAVPRSYTERRHMGVDALLAQALHIAETKEYAKC